jgi:hypothetical protein
MKLFMEGGIFPKHLIDQKIPASLTTSEGGLITWFEVTEKISGKHEFHYHKNKRNPII